MAVLAAPQREGGELQARGPALGALLETREIAGVEIEAERVVEQARRLVVGEAEVVRARTSTSCAARAAARAASGGSAREAIAICTVSGRCSSRKSTASWILGSGITW